MGLLQRSLFYTALSLVFLSFLLGEVDARRKILQGRKTITRTYYKSPAVPAWGIVVIVSFCMLIVGGILYVVLRKIMLGGTTNSGVTTTYQHDDEV